VAKHKAGTIGTAGTGTIGPAKSGRQNKRAQTLKQKIRAENQRRQDILNRLKGTPQTINKGGSPGVPSPTIQPFMTAQDMMNQGDAQSKYDSALADADYGLEQTRINTEAQKHDVDLAHTRGVANAEDDLASRGLFRSGVRDSQLWDLDATAAFNRSQLDTNLNLATMQTQRVKDQASAAWNRFQKAMDQQQVENAQNASEAAGPYSVDPVAGQDIANPAYANLQAQNKKLKGQIGKQQKQTPNPPKLNLNRKPAPLVIKGSHPKASIGGGASYRPGGKKKK
jgi:hypothetical protein